MVYCSYLLAKESHLVDPQQFEKPVDIQIVNADLQVKVRLEGHQSVYRNISHRIKKQSGGKVSLGDQLSIHNKYSLIMVASYKSDY